MSLKKTYDLSLDSLTKVGKNAQIDGHVATHRRELGELKIGPSFEFIKTQLESGREKIVVFAHHRKTLFTLMEKFTGKYKYVSIMGGDGSELKHRAVTIFQSCPDIRLFFGSIQAAGVGITLTAASYVVFVEPSWVPGENFQAIDRCHRIGQKDNVQADFLVFEKSLDERILKVVLKKTR